MRCLYIVASDPISPNFRGGGSVIYYEHLAALAELGHDIHLWHYAYPDTRQAFEQFVASDAAVWSEVQRFCRSMTMTTFPGEQSFSDRLRNKVFTWVLGRNPVPRSAAAKELQRLLSQIQPDVIWAQHFEPALLACSQSNVPVVYSHHDWLYRIKALRFGRAEDPKMRRLEERVTRQVTAVVSGSAVECEDLRRIGCQQVHYIPVSGSPVPWDATARAAEPPWLVHLGGMGTTASRQGLERFFDLVWPELGKPRPELVAVGDLTAAPAKLQALLAKVTCTGHVKDLTTVLRPFDLHIIPWEHSTGTRTRVPVAFNHGQVVVAVRAAVACFPEARDEENCRLVDRLELMAPVIQELMRDGDQRERLGRAARQTFERAFTRHILRSRFAAVLAAVL